MEFYGTYIHGDTLTDSDKYNVPELLFLHGENPEENRTVFNALRQLLLNKHHLSSCGFDFIGHGSTGGDWNNTCLQQRTQQATEVIDGCFDSQPLSIITMGTGIFNAIQLLNTQRIVNLVFIAPVLPPEELETLPLSLLVKRADPTTRLQWLTNTHPATLDHFRGNISLITSTQDKALPDWLKATPRSPGSIASRSYPVICIPPDQPELNLMQAANHHPKILLKMAGIIAETIATTHSQAVST